jgi:6-phosphogluconolactonase
MANLNVETDGAALAGAAARRITALLHEACGRDSTAHLCLTGGQTPRDTYARLVHAAASMNVDWNRVHLFWGDERLVPPDHEESNFGMADEALIVPAAIPSRNIHRMRGELPDAEQAARDYERILRRYERPGRPRFDVMLLGLGEDAHIASLFPGSPLLSAASAGAAASAPGHWHDAPLAAGIWVPSVERWRITLTPPALLDASAILMLTSGAAKADAVKAALQGADDVSHHPAQLLRQAGERVEWWMDRAAASRL